MCWLKSCCNLSRWLLEVTHSEIKCVTCWIKVDWPARVLRLLSHACTQNTHTTHTYTLWINSCLRYQSISRSLSLLMWINWAIDLTATQYFIYFTDVKVSEWSAACWHLENFPCPFWPSVAQVSFACRCTNVWGWKVLWPAIYDAIFRKSVIFHKTKSHRFPGKTTETICSLQITFCSTFYEGFFSDSNAAVCSISGKWAPGFSFNMQQ